MFPFHDLCSFLRLKKTQICSLLPLQETLQDRQELFQLTTSLGWPSFFSLSGCCRVRFYNSKPVLNVAFPAVPCHDFAQHRDSLNTHFWHQHGAASAGSILSKNYETFKLITVEPLSCIEDIPCLKRPLEYQPSCDWWTKINNLRMTWALCISK